MGSTFALVSLGVAVTVALFGAVLVSRLIKTMLELRKVTTGLNSALGWALGHVAAEANNTAAAVRDRALPAGSAQQKLGSH